MVVLPQGLSDVGNIKGSICLVREDGISDYGKWVEIGQRDVDFDFVVDLEDDGGSVFIITKSIIYRRSINYWYGSPYGWYKVECTGTCLEERRRNFLDGR